MSNQEKDKNETRNYTARDSATRNFTGRNSANSHGNDSYTGGYDELYRHAAEEKANTQEHTQVISEEEIRKEEKNQIPEENYSDDYKTAMEESREETAEEMENEFFDDESEELPEEIQASKGSKKKGMLRSIMEEFDFHEVSRKKKVRKKKNYLVRFLIAAGVILCIVLFMMSSVFQVDTIEVKGNSYYKNAEVIEIAGLQKGANLFFGVDKSEAVERLEENPYFENAKIKKTLPGKVTINVDERRQVAALKYGEIYIILDEEGLVLRKNKVDPKITILKGFKISAMTVGQPVLVEEQQTLKNALAVVNAANDGDFYFKRIDCSKVIFKAYVCDTLPVKGTAKQIKNALEKGDLQKVVNKLLDDETKRGTINLGNGNYVSFSPDFN